MLLSVALTVIRQLVAGSMYAGISQGASGGDTTIGEVPVVEVVGGVAGTLTGGIVWSGYVITVEGDCVTVVEPPELATPDDADALAVPEELEAEPPEIIGPGLGAPSGTQFETYGVLELGSTAIAIPDAVVLLKTASAGPAIFGVEAALLGPAAAAPPRAGALPGVFDNAASPVEVLESLLFDVNPTVAAMIATIAVAVDPAPKNVSRRFLVRTRVITFPSASSTSVDESEIVGAFWLGSNGFCDSSMQIKSQKLLKTRSAVQRNFFRGDRCRAALRQDPKRQTHPKSIIGLV